jgi:hypothetical protein
MTIRKGETWGTSAPVPADVVQITADADLRALVRDAWAAGQPCPPVALVGGDLCRTLGGGDARRFETGTALRFAVDVGVVSLDDAAPEPFVAHLVARRTRWAGTFAVVMNAAWVGEWYLGPRAHPNDGLLDLTTGSLAPMQRLLARRRAPSGTHLPHPALTTRRSGHHEVTFTRPTPVHLDGEAAGRARRLVVDCRPDQLWCWV